MKQEYHYIRLEGHKDSRTVFFNGDLLDPAISIKVRNHSPDGFNWSYAGSGPSQLALAILMKITTIEEALALYQQFKFNVIAMLPEGNFSITLNMHEEIKKAKTELNLI